MSRPLKQYCTSLWSGNLCFFLSPSKPVHTFQPIIFNLQLLVVKTERCFNFVGRGSVFWGHGERKMGRWYTVAFTMLQESLKTTFSSTFLTFLISHLTDLHGLLHISCIFSRQKLTRSISNLQVVFSFEIPCIYFGCISVLEQIFNNKCNDFAEERAFLIHISYAYYFIFSILLHK